MNKTLYDQDFQQWINLTIEQLRAHNFASLDIEHLIEELEDLGKSEKSAVESLLEQLIRHLLLINYWDSEVEYSGSHWQAEIQSFRKQLTRKLTKNLQNHLESNLDFIYKDALEYVRIKTQNKIAFPENNPFTLTEILG